MVADDAGIGLDRGQEDIDIVLDLDPEDTETLLDLFQEDIETGQDQESIESVLGDIEETGPGLQSIQDIVMVIEIVVSRITGELSIETVPLRIEGQIKRIQKIWGEKALSQGGRKTGRVFRKRRVCQRKKTMVKIF